MLRGGGSRLGWEEVGETILPLVAHSPREQTLLGSPLPLLGVPGGRGGFPPTRLRSLTCKQGESSLLGPPGTQNGWGYLWPGTQHSWPHGAPRPPTSLASPLRFKEGRLKRHWRAVQMLLPVPQG